MARSRSVVVHDLRTRQQLDVIRRYGGVLANIERASARIVDDPLEGLLEQESFDFHLDNNRDDAGTYLFGQLDEIVEWLKRRSA